MDELRNTKKLVREALKINILARNSDNYLYYLICKAKMKSLGADIDSISFRDGLLRKNEFGLPAFETVRRARQKIQAQHPELSGSAEVEEMRAINEESYREFAKEG